MDKNLIEAYKRNYFNSAVADVYRAIRGKCFQGSFTLLFCLIDSLASIEYGENAKGYTFNEWINDWLLPYNKFYFKRDKLLYAARCSLVHAYGVSERQSTINASISFSIKQGLHLQMFDGDGIDITEPKGGVFIVNLTDLLIEVTFGAFDFFDWIIEHKSNDKEIIERLGKLMKPFIQASDINNSKFLSLSEYPYEKMDSCLSIFDNYEKLPDDKEDKRNFLMHEIQRIPSIWELGFD